MCVYIKKYMFAYVYMCIYVCIYVCVSIEWFVCCVECFVVVVRARFCCVYLVALTSAFVEPSTPANASWHPSPQNTTGTNK